MAELTFLIGWLVTAIPIIFGFVMLFRLVKAVEKIADTLSRRDT